MVPRRYEFCFGSVVICTMHSPSYIPRDWLGRRIDLREFHRDPRCRTHEDPLETCSCHVFFRDWDWILDWAFCIGIVLTVVILTWTLETVLAPPAV